jgi:hypothetical protein
VEEKTQVKSNKQRSQSTTPIHKNEETAGNATMAEQKRAPQQKEELEVSFRADTVSANAS